MKRNLYIILGAVVVVAIVIGAFWFISSNRSAPVSTGSTGTLPQAGSQGTSSGSGSTAGSTGTTGTAGDGTAAGNGASSTVKSFGVISPDEALDYFVDPSNNAFLINTSGTIEEISAGKASILSPTASNIIQAGFSYNGRKAFVISGDPANPQTNIFDTASSTWTTLPAGIVTAAWAPTDLRIAYLTSPATGTISLWIANAATPKTAPAALLTLNANDLSVEWASPTQILLSGKPSSFAAGSLWVYDTLKKTITPIVSERNGLEYIWSGPASSSAPIGLVFGSLGTGRGGTLQLDDLSGNTVQQLSFVTLPSKCVFTAETSTAATASYLALYCGIPRDQNALTFANLPDAYEQMSLFTSDDFYHVNLQTGAISSVWQDQTQNIDASDMKFANGTLFFINRYDQKLYGLMLSQV